MSFTYYDYKNKNSTQSYELYTHKRFKVSLEKFQKELFERFNRFYMKNKDEHNLHDKNFILNNFGIFSKYSNFDKFKSYSNNIHFGINGEIVITNDNVIHFRNSNCLPFEIFLQKHYKSFETTTIDGYCHLSLFSNLKTNDCYIIDYDEKHRYTSDPEWGDRKISQNGKPLTFNKNTIKCFEVLLKHIKPFCNGIDKKIIDDTFESENKKNIIELNIFKDDILSEFEKNNDGIIVLLDNNDFTNLLQKYQSKVIEFDKSYVLKFVKISNYLNEKRNNIIQVFDTLKKIDNKDGLLVKVDFLKNQIFTYESIIFHSISMLTSLVHNDLITFYEIHECLDKLGIFNSNWENEINNKLNSIEYKLDDILNSIYEMEISMIKSMKMLSYVTKNSFKNLEKSISIELDGINSNIKFNNLLNTIQTYKMLTR